MTFRPMLAIDHKEWMLRFPYYASPKLDGIRCLVIDGGAKTRSMKRFPNRFVDAFFRDPTLDGLDGELIVGEPTAADCYRQTVSALMSEDGRPDFRFLVFDRIDVTGRERFLARKKRAIQQIRKRISAGLKRVSWLEDVLVCDLVELARFEKAAVQAGYEGVMLRHPEGRYKQGRATLNEGTLLKVKRTRDAEAIILRVEEQMHNTNTARKNEIGRTHRSTAKAGLIGKGTAGAIVVTGAPGQPFAGIEFGIGTGFDDALRAKLWEQRHRIAKARLVVRYRYVEIGAYDAPRHPVFVSFRPDGA